MTFVIARFQGEDRTLFYSHFTGGSPPPFFVVLHKEALLEVSITKAFHIGIIKLTLARMSCTNNKGI
jgi:hypothetical protein